MTEMKRVRAKVTYSREQAIEEEITKIHADSPFIRLRDEKYMRLTTFRRDGRGVATRSGSREGEASLAFTGAQTGKAKRIRATKSVTIAPCTIRGVVTGPTWSGTARILPKDERDRVMKLIFAKYRVTKRLLDMLVGVIRVIARKPQTHTV